MMEDLIKFLEENQKSEGNGGNLTKLYYMCNGSNIYKDSDLTIMVNKEELKEIFMRGCVVFDSDDYYGNIAICYIDEMSHAYLGCIEVNDSGNVIASRYYSSEYTPELE